MVGAGEAGVVLFSMGATFDVSAVPPLLLRRLLSAFSQLPQRVLMRVGGRVPEDIVVPPNVRTARWLPQQDVLGQLLVLLIRQCHK